jgi:hypothetical protein
MSDVAQKIEQLLAADSTDPGCEATLEVFDLYVEADLAGRDPARRFPGAAAHLRSCPACRKDYDGLIAVVEAFPAAS